AVSINLTNLSAVGIYSEDSVELEMSTGRTFRITCSAYPTLLLETPQANNQDSAGTNMLSVTLDQSGEAAEFSDFINA
ncbi:hypothetical protein QP475_14090, partial [Lacticaseibacillus rhamnosus]